MKPSTSGTSGLLWFVTLAFAGLAHGFDLDAVILQDMMFQQGSTQCTDSVSTDISFVHTPSPSTWSSANAAKEPKNFMAQMTHSDSDPNRSWTVRFGKGGSIYSMRGAYGEAVPPQRDGFSPWVDEVHQSVAIDIAQNGNCGASSSKCFYIHQAGTYFEDTTYLSETFYSPNVGMHCEGNTCIFATWGQIAKNPTIFESDLLYVHQYKDCGMGVIEYTQLFVGYFGGQIAYLNMPWAGVRASSLPDFYLSSLDYNMANKYESMHTWGGAGEIIPLLNTMGGYSTFAQNLASEESDNPALSYVHGVNDEYNDSSNTYFRVPYSIRFGVTGRDYTVFTVRARITSTNPDNSFVHRQYLINDKLGNIKSQAQQWISEAKGDMFLKSEFSGRRLAVYTEGTSLFGVAAASTQGGNSTTCLTGTIECRGSTVPSDGHEPFFAIKCGPNSYFGPDKYHFSPSPDSAGLIRAYVCEGLAVGVIPELKLLGFFRPNCTSLSTAVYDSNFCEEVSKKICHYENNILIASFSFISTTFLNIFHSLKFTN